MKKIIIGLLIIISIINVAGCKRKEDTKVATGIQTETVDELNSNLTDGLTPQASVTNPVKATTIDSDIQSAAVGTQITDEQVLEEFKKYIEKFYYNILFSTDPATGEITPSAMQLFAISYIYQYENKDLLFDVNTFVLKIPDEFVTEVIRRFFDYEFTSHYYPSAAGITYEGGDYLMPATSKVDKPEPYITRLVKTSDSSYAIYFEAINEDDPLNPVVYKYEAVVEEKDGRLIMLNYRQTEPLPEVTEEEDTTDETAEETTDDTNG